MLSRPYAACLAEVGLARRTLWALRPASAASPDSPVQYRFDLLRGWGGRCSLGGTE